MVKWKDQNNRKPLIIRGARQVGKSWVIIDFGQNHFEGNLHLVNLEKQLDWHSIFELNLDANRIVTELEILLNTDIVTGKDIIFFDEIQSCPKAIAALRYFYEQLPNLHVIAAGSLLEFALQDIPFPVGRVQIMNMFPMCFTEYLQAVGKERLVKNMVQNTKGQSDTIHNLIRAELRNYFFVGGMPECVATYANTKSMKAVQAIQADLLDSFRQDFSKYNPQVDKNCLNDVLFSTAASVGQTIKYARLSENFSIPTIKKAFTLLETALLIHKIKATSPAGLPIGASASTKKFKAIMLDIGLLVRLSGLSISVEYQKKELLSMFQGALAEQFVGQELLASGQSQLYYWARNAKSSNAEVDYLTSKDGKIIPIEVKNSASGRLRSLHLLLETFPNVDLAYVFTDGKQGELPEQKLLFLPLYKVYHTFLKTRLLSQIKNQHVVDKLSSRFTDAIQSF